MAVCVILVPFAIVLDFTKQLLYCLLNDINAAVNYWYSSEHDAGIRVVNWMPSDVWVFIVLYIHCHSECVVS